MNDIGLRAELNQLIEKLAKTGVAGYGIEISSDKSEILVHSINSTLSTNKL